MRAPAKLYFASSNPGKLAEFRVLGESYATGERSAVSVELLPRFESLPAFEENAPTFGENALGKALYYSQLSDGLLFADDSGLAVDALSGAPGVHSARYAGPHATSAERIAKLLDELRGKPETERAAHFCCVIAVIRKGLPVAIVSNRVDGVILESPRGAGGFGYDPVFYLPALGKTFAELSAAEKNQHSHRGKAFRRVLALLDTF
ncbi:MAG: RdgB/HAM1 family non-canonical purine NTP pyrophosphatase [Candidatus Acidiferrum sp.]